MERTSGKSTIFNKLYIAAVLLVVGFLISLQLIGVSFEQNALAGCLVFVAVVAGVVFFLQQNLEQPLTKLDLVSKAILYSDNNRLNDIGFEEKERFPSFFKLLEGNTTQASPSATQAATSQNSALNESLLKALDVCQANVMLADVDCNITYANQSVKEMLLRNESTLRTKLPNFNVATLVGTCVDQFHVNPSHQRGLLSNLRQPYHTKLAVAELHFDLIATPVFANDGTRLGTVVEWQDITEQLKAEQLAAKEAASNARIASALKVCQANVMMADEDLNIVYLNDSVKTMLKGNEAKLRTVLSNFNADKLLGVCVDDFHANPSHQRNMLAKLTSTYNTKLELAGLTFELIATPVFDDDGKRLGTVVEWEDISEELTQRQSAEQEATKNGRIASALKVCQANVMMADENYNIVYVNDSVTEMLRTNQTKLREVLPQFNVDTLIGTSIDSFHVNPAHQRGMLDKLTSVYKTDLKLAGFTFGLIATPVFDSSGKRIGTVVEWDDKTERLALAEQEKAIATENSRVRQALDSVKTNTMIADATNTIVYMNNSLVDMMKHAESDIRKDLPKFDASKLLGMNMDAFHKNPAHQQGMVKALSSTYQAEIVVGGRTFALTANPIISADEQRIGTVVEWVDRTDEVAIEKEVDRLVTSASQGVLSMRIAEDDKEGFFLNLAKGLNSLVSIADEVIGETVEMLDAMAHGDLTKRINSDYQGSFDKLKQDANATAEKLTEIIEKVSVSSNLVASGAEEISQGNADLSQRTEEQASSLEETASSMEEMTSTVRQNADNSKVATDLASEAREKAQQGGEVVERAVASMAEINDSSKKISDIIGVIDEIAFQTNLLALNAAVEAARAGEQGRGFAVVAGEVRNLAQRSAAAAKEIKELIRDSVSKVEDGTLLVNESGDTLREIVASVQRVSEMISDISIASEEQSSGIEQVNKAVTQMDEMTQQNAALVEQASAASESMAEQANTMRQLLGFFRVSDTGATKGYLKEVSSNSSSSANRPTARIAPSRSERLASPSPNKSETGVSNFVDSADEWEEF